MDLLFLLLVLAALFWAMPYVLMGVAMWGLAHGVHCWTAGGRPAGGGDPVEAARYRDLFIRRGLIAALVFIGLGLPFVILGAVW